jgi:hypothetical protein
MRMYICTFPRMRTLKIVFAAFAVVTFGMASLAQNERPKRGVAQAELQINVIVVPVVIPPRHHRHRDRDEGSVSYNLFPLEEKLSITEEVRAMQVNARQEQVRITTVVTK